MLNFHRWALLITWIWALILSKVKKFLVNKSIALLLTTSVLLVLKCHNVDICQTTRAYALLECSELAWGKLKLLDLWVFHRVWSAAYELSWQNPHVRLTSEWAPEVYVANPGSVPASALRSQSVRAEQLRECLSRTGTRVSIQTVQNRLHSAGFRARRPYVGVPLSQRHRQARLAWTRQHCRWINQQWATVLFTNESRFLLDMFDRRCRVWHHRGERYANCAIVEHDWYGGGSLMVWGGISVRSRTELLVLNGTLTGQRYINEVLQPVVLPFVQQHHVVLQDDNARPHRARIVQQFLQQNSVDHLDWPARSPDLSPIEHVWDILGQCVRQRVPRPRMLQALGAALQEEWRRIPQLQIARLIRSMRRRCVACIDATGAHTRYWQICEVLLVTLVIFHTNSHLVLQTPADGFLSVNEMM